MRREPSALGRGRQQKEGSRQLAVSESAEPNLHLRQVRHDMSPTTAFPDFRHRPHTPPAP